MAESTNTPAGQEGTNEQTGPADQSGGGNEPRTFTQAEVDHIVQERLARAKATPPADYEDLKAKAARLDEIEEANKSDIQKANDAASRAKARADEWKAKYEAMQAEQERMSRVAKYSAQYKIDAGTLSRMAGDVEDNAKYLASVEAARPRYPGIVDDGTPARVGQTLDEIDKIANPVERIIATAKYYRDNPDN